jgi:hypothetical protein
MREISVAVTRRIFSTADIDQPREEGVRSWFESGSFQIDTGSTAESIILNRANLPDLAPFIAWDYERFALSSIESWIESITLSKRPKAIGWPLLKLYYAAFFGGHAVMRATGKGIIRLEQKNANNLAELSGLFMSKIAVTAGTYLFEISQSEDRTLNLTLKKLTGTGGAHDLFWRQFYIFLTKLSEEVAAADETEAAAVISEISDLQSILSTNGMTSGTWLSAVRNQINYRHQYSAWFPYTPSNQESFTTRAMNRKTSAGIRKDYNPGKNPLNAFNSTCRLISEINREIALEVGRRETKNRFGRLLKRIESN